MNALNICLGFAAHLEEMNALNICLRFVTHLEEMNDLNTCLGFVTHLEERGFVTLKEERQGTVSIYKYC